MSLCRELACVSVVDEQWRVLLMDARRVEEGREVTKQTGGDRWFEGGTQNEVVCAICTWPWASMDTSH
jgi:hypothetical protein